MEPLKPRDTTTYDSNSGLDIKNKLFISLVIVDIIGFIILTLIK